jgi:uncharacterized protein (TIGR03032 family)
MLKALSGMSKKRAKGTPEAGNGQGAEPAAPAGEQPEVKFELTTSRQFDSWLAEQNINLVFTTYQVGKLFFLGIGQKGKLSVFNRTLERCMGLAYGDGALWVATLYQVLKFVDVVGRQRVEGGYDSLFVPQVSYYTGDVDAHDLAVTPGGGILFVNTLFSCIATVSETHSFKLVWKPPFIDRLAAEDRCHLNGLALDNGKLRYATAVSDSNVADGWRDHRGGGGIVMDCQSNEIIARGLSMPHSPRLHKGKLYVLNSGTGHFGTIDPTSGKFEPIAFCPGYLRGLAIVGNFALIGLSKPRENKTFSGLALDDNLQKHKIDARCGIYVVDLKSGDIVHWARLEGLASELYDVAVLPDRKNTAAVGFRSDEIRRVISVEE